LGGRRSKDRRPELQKKAVKRGVKRFSREFPGREAMEEEETQFVKFLLLKRLTEWGEGPDRKTGRNTGRKWEYLLPYNKTEQPLASRRTWKKIDQLRRGSP